MTENKCSAISEFKMSLTLKRGEPEWLETLQQDVANQALALLIGDDGCQISVPVAILVATSSLVRSVSAVLLPPAISPVALSVPGVAGDVLKIVVEMIVKGKSYSLNAEQIQKVDEVFEVLGFGAVLNSYDPESCEIKVEVQYENTIEAFEIGEIGEAGVSSSNDSKLEGENNISVIEEDIKVELNSKSEELESTPLHDRKANRKKKIRNKSYVCDECKYETLYKSSFIRHVRIHTGEKPFECDQCDYKANNKGNLTKHKRIHAVVKPYVCDQCDFKCSHSSQLKQHQRIHSEKPYACDQCQFKGFAISQLRSHIRIHTGEKPFSCDKCEFKANCSSILFRHNRIHSGEKPFSCDQREYKE